MKIDEIYKLKRLAGIIDKEGNTVDGDDESNISIVGSENELAKSLINQEIHKIDLAELAQQRIIIKGCADILDPAYAMSYLVAHLQPYVKSIMYGEPCSTVPIYKKS